MSNYTQSSSRFIRETYWARQYPFDVAVASVPEVPHWANYGTLQGISQCIEGGEKSYIFREDNGIFDYQPTKLVLERLDIKNPRFVGQEDFDTLTNVFAAGISNLDKMRKLIETVAKLAPEFQVMPTHLLHLLENEEYKHVSRFFHRHDLSEFEAIVRVGAGVDQISPKRFEEWKVRHDQYIHLGSGWYAFRDIDDAVTTKFYYGALEIYELRK